MTVDRQSACLAALCILALMPFRLEAQARPVMVVAMAEQERLEIGEPLVVDLLVINISGEDLEPFTVFNSTPMTLVDPEGFTAEGCEASLEPGPPGLRFSWDVEGLPPAGRENCRLIFPATKRLGSQLVWLAARFPPDIVYEEISGFVYLIAEPPPPPPPIDLAVSLEQNPIVAGDPLIINLEVSNVSGEVLGSFTVFSQPMSLIGPDGFAAEGCHVTLAAAETHPWEPPAWIFSWDIAGLQPEEAASCRLTFPTTLILGREFVSLTAAFPPDDEFTRWGFGYRILAEAPVLPVELEASLAQSTLLVGEPLVIDMQVTNISDEAVSLNLIYSGLIHLTWFTGHIAEGCHISFALTSPAPGGAPAFSFIWGNIPELQPGESAQCRVTFPRTLFPGTETFHLSTQIDGFVWRLAEITYTLLSEHPPPVPVPVNRPLWLWLLMLLVLWPAWRRLRLP